MSTSCYLSLSKNTDRKSNYHNVFRVTKRDFQALPDYIVTSVWSPIVWERGKRKKTSFQLTNLMAFDFDSGEWTLEDAENWANTLHVPFVLGTTKSHQKEKVSGESVSPACDRFRLVFLAEDCMDIEDYEYTMRSLMDEIPCDTSCKDGARFFFPCTKIVATGFERSRDRVEWMKCPPEETRAAKMERALAASKNVSDPLKWPRWLKRAIESGVGVEASRHTTIYRIGCYFGLSDASENIIQIIMDSKLGEIGEADVRRAFQNGQDRVQQDYAEYRERTGEADVAEESASSSDEPEQDGPPDWLKEQAQDLADAAAGRKPRRSRVTEGAKGKTGQKPKPKRAKKARPSPKKKSSGEPHGLENTPG